MIRQIIKGYHRLNRTCHSINLGSLEITPSATLEFNVLQISALVQDNLKMCLKVFVQPPTILKFLAYLQNLLQRFDICLSDQIIIFVKKVGNIHGDQLLRINDF